MTDEDLDVDVVKLRRKSLTVARLRKETNEPVAVCPRAVRLVRTFGEENSPLLESPWLELYA
jgi:hypothetical protein